MSGFFEDECDYNLRENHRKLVYGDPKPSRYISPVQECLKFWEELYEYENRKRLKS